MFVYKIILFIFYVTLSQCRHPDKVYCVNEKCSEPISKAKTLLNYASADKDLMSFRANADAVVYMKSAGTHPDLWYATIDGKSGLVNSKFLRENKIHVKNPQIVAPFEVTKKENQSIDVQPDKVQQAHEVIEGTTIYTTEANLEQGSTTESPVTEPIITPDLNVNKESSVTQSDDSVNLNSENSDPPQQSFDSISTEKLQSESSSENQNQNSDSPVEQTLQESVDNKVGIEQNVEQTNQVLPNILADALPPQDLGASSSETIEVPDLNYVQNTLKKAEDVDSVELNSSLPHSSEENTIAVETASANQKQLDDKKIESNVIENIADQDVTQNTNGIKPEAVIEDVISALLKNDMLNASEETDQKKESKPYEVEKSRDSFETKNEEVNVISTKDILALPKKEVTENSKEEIAVKADNVNENAKQDTEAQTERSIDSSNEEVTPSPLENKNEILKEPIIPQNNEEKNTEPIPTTPNLDIIPPLVIPPQIPEVTTQAPVEKPTTETLPPIFTYPEIITQPPPLQHNNYQSQEPVKDPINYFSNEPVKNEPSNYYTQEPGNSEPPNYTPDPQNPINNDAQVPIDTSNYYTQELDSNPSTQEPTDNNYKNEPQENVEHQTEPPIELNQDPTESTTQETGEGFLSNMYSTLADIWPSTTEAPPSLFNEEVPKYDEKESGFSFMSYIMSTYYSVMGPNEDIKALFPSHGETCFTDEYCDGKGNSKPNRLLTFLVTTAASVLLFTLGYYYIDSKRQDSRLIGNINSLQRDLLFSTKECEILKEELSTTKSKLAGIEDSSFGMDDMVLSLKEEINEHKAQNARLRNSLDDNEKLLRVSENTAGELQNTLSEVENTLSELWGERANFEEQIAELNGKIQAFEEELITVTRDRDSYQLKYVSAETALEESKRFTKQIDELNQQLNEAKNTIELQKHELTALKDAMKELKSGSGGDVDVSSLIDHTEIKAKLNKAMEEKNALSSKYEVELAERKRLTDELQTTKDSYRTTSQQATEAMTRLDVLGKYFQERESELMKELSAKESLWLSKQGESASTVEKIELLQQEVQRYKEKCDALTLELAEQESNRRTAISEVETRAHAAWLEARAARREADAARDEAATLRRKLASVAIDNTDTHHKVVSPLELSDGVLPPPLPPLAFLPPLLPPLPRPPPLGRLPSPHPPRYAGDRRYTPDIRYSPESRYSPETVRYSPDSRYSPRRRSPYSPRSRRRSKERYSPVGPAGRSSRSRNGPAPPDTETEYNSDSPTREPRRRRYSRHSGPSSGSGCSSESEK